MWTKINKIKIKLNKIYLVADSFSFVRWRWQSGDSKFQEMDFHLRPFGDHYGRFGIHRSLLERKMLLFQPNRVWLITNFLSRKCQEISPIFIFHCPFSTFPNSQDIINNCHPIYDNGTMNIITNSSKCLKLINVRSFCLSYLLK